MAVAYDAATRWPTTQNTADATTGTRTFTHTPVGTPAGIVVIIVSTEIAASQTGVSYGGTAMTLDWEATNSNEGGRCEVWVMDSRHGAIPTGAQTVQISGATTAAKFAVCFSVTSATGLTEVHASGGVDPETVGANPQTSLTYTASAIMFAGMHWGGTSWPTAPLAGQTEVAWRDFGADSGIISRRGVEGAGTHSIGWTATTEDYIMVAVALTEKIAAQEINGNRAVTATLSGDTALDKPVSGDTTVTTSRTGALALDKPVSGNLGVTAALTGSLDVVSPPVEVAGNLAVTATTSGEAMTGKDITGNLVISLRAWRARRSLTSLCQEAS